MKVLPLLLLVACAATEPEPLAGPLPPDVPEETQACLADAKITVSDVIETRSGATLAHVKLEGLDPFTRVSIASPGVNPAHVRPLLPPVLGAFTQRTIDPQPTQSVSSSVEPRGFFGTIGHLLKGAVVGLSNLVMLPLNLPLSIIDSKREMFPFSWNAGTVSDAYPSAQTHPFFEDTVLDATVHGAKKASYDARLASVTAKTTEADRRAREVEYGQKCSAKDGVYECDVMVNEGSPLEVVLAAACQKTLTATLPPRDPYSVLDESLGSSRSANLWYEHFGTRTPQLVAAASAEDAFKLAATSEETKLDDATVACRVSTKRPDAKKKKSVLAARFSFGDLMAVGATVQARGAGEPMTFVVPHVTLAAQGQVKLAVMDSSVEWGGAATTLFEEKPLTFTHERFEAECRTLGAAQTQALAQRSLERLQVQPDLPDAAFDFDPKNQARTAARLKLFDGVRDIEALVGRKSETAKAAQTFADARIKTWAMRVQRAMVPLIERAQRRIALGDATLELVSVTRRSQACSVKALVTAQKKKRFSLERELKKLRFLDKNGNLVEPFFLEPDDTMLVTSDQPLAVQFDIPAVSKAEVCAVALRGDAPPLIIEAAK